MGKMIFFPLGKGSIKGLKSHEIAGCKVMIASRNFERLSASTKDLQKEIRPGSTAEVDCVQCNIRNEKQVKWCIIWAPSSEFVSSSIPSWQILTAYAQPFRGARDLAFCLKVPLDSLLVWASSEGSGETARMRRLAWTFAARIGYKYQIRLTRSI